MKNFKIVSACLLGVECRYDGQAKSCQKIIELGEEFALIPVCPEQLGGLSTPRESAEQQKSGKVLTKSGKDVTENFQKGAQQVLKIAKLLGAKDAILKQKSPSCGCGKIYSGNFSQEIINGDGITTTLLKENGIKVVTEEEIL